MTESLLIVLIVLVVILLVIGVLLLSRSEKKGAQNFAAETLLHSLSDTRKELSEKNDALRGNMEASLEKIRNELNQSSAKEADTRVQIIQTITEMQKNAAENALEQTRSIAQSIEKMQASNEKKLEEMRVTVDEKLNNTLTQRLDSSFKTVSEQLSKVYTSLGEMKEISGGITSLNRVLSGVKTRGTWAEAQLETILDQIIPGMYVKNFLPGTGRDVVEFAVKVPSADALTPDVYLPLDSKFPMEDYLRLCDACDEGNMQALADAKKALESRILTQAKEVSKYIQPPVTTPFAVMYVATDSLYAEIVSSKSNIADRVHHEYHVLIAGPSTVTALLSAIASGYRTAALNAKAAEVMDLLAIAKAQYEKFGEAIEKAKKKLDEAGRSLEDVDKRNTLIVKKLKSVETLEEADADKLLT